MFRIAVAGMMGLTGCAGAGPTLESVAARVLDADANGVGMAFDVNVNNPLPVPIKSIGGKYGIDIDGTPFMNWDEVPGLDLAAGKVGTVTLPARLEYEGIVKTFQTMATAREIPYRLHGALMFPGNMEVPFEHDGTMPGPADAVRGGLESLIGQ